MGKAFIDDISGATLKGDGLMHTDVKLGDDLRLRVVPFVRTGKQQFTQGKIGSKTAENIKAALTAKAVGLKETKAKQTKKTT